MLSRLFQKIKDTFHRLFHPIIFNLEEEYSDILEKSGEISTRNVLVGTVRRRDQLAINLANNFYHIPLGQLITDRDIEYVALYQSKNLFNLETDSNGVAYFGKITNSKVLKRSQISEIPSSSADEYYRFDIESWVPIASPIIIRELYPKVFSRTSFWQLCNAKFTNELYFESADSYILYLGMQDIVNDIYDGFVYKGFHVIRRGKRLLIKYNRTKITIKIKDFINSPFAKTMLVFNAFSNNSFNIFNKNY